MTTNAKKSKSPEPKDAEERPAAAAARPSGTLRDDERPLPAWFQRSKHIVATDGIFEHDTGVLLDADGAPRSPAVRAARERAEKAETAATDKKEN